MIFVNFLTKWKTLKRLKNACKIQFFRGIVSPPGSTVSASSPSTWSWVRPLKAFSLVMSHCPRRIEQASVTWWISFPSARYFAWVQMDYFCQKSLLIVLIVDIVRLNDKTPNISSTSIWGFIYPIDYPLYTTAFISSFSSLVQRFIYCNTHII